MGKAFGAPIVLTLLAAACGGSNPSTTTTTSPASPSATPTVQSVTLSANATALTQVGSTTQVSATATLSNGTSSDVTPVCTGWQSDTASVVTVSSGGLLTAHTAGTAAITATCDGVAARVALTLTFPGTRLFISGTATDATSGWALPNVLIQVADGVNAGISTRTNAMGAFDLFGLTAGTFNVVASAPQAYLPARQSVTLVSDTWGFGIALPRAPAAVATSYDLTLTITSLTNCVNQANMPTSPGQLAAAQAFTSTGLWVGSSDLQYIVPNQDESVGVDLELQRNGTAASGALTFSLHWPGAFHPYGTYLTDAPLSGAFDANGQFSGTASGTYDNEGFPTYIDCNIQLGVVLMPHH